MMVDATIVNILLLRLLLVRIQMLLLSFVGITISSDGGAAQEISKSELVVLVQNRVYLREDVAHRGRRAHTAFFHVRSFNDGAAYARVSVAVLARRRRTTKTG